jgi:hypothetical protein
LQIASEKTTINQVLKIRSNQMKHKEENLEAFMVLIDKIDTVQIEIESLLSLMDFSDTDKEAEFKIETITNGFSEVSKSNRDKFVMKIITVLESMH